MEETAFLAGERREKTAWDSDGAPLVDRGRVSCEHPATGIPCHQDPLWVHLGKLAGPIEESLHVPDAFAEWRAAGDEAMDELRATGEFAMTALGIRSVRLGGKSAGGRSAGDEATSRRMLSDVAFAAHNLIAVIVIEIGTGITPLSPPAAPKAASKPPAKSKFLAVKLS